MNDAEKEWNKTREEKNKNEEKKSVSLWNGHIASGFM